MTNQIPTRREIREKRRRNEIAARIEELGLKRSDFDFTGTKLTHRVAVTEFFEFGRLDEELRIIALSVPGQPPDTRRYSSLSKLETDQQFTDWCKALKKYFEEVEEHLRTPDLFGEGANVGFVMGTFPTLAQPSNDFLSESEKSLVLQRLDELQIHISEQLDAENELIAERLEALNQRIEYLKDASEGVGRQHWLDILYSVLVHFVVSGIYDPARAHELGQFAFALFEFLVTRRLPGI